MSRLFKTTFIATIISFTLIGCEKPKEDSATSDKTATTQAFKSCMVSDSGGFDDKSFNESGKNGLEKAKKDFGIEIALAESKGPEDFKKNVDSLISQKCDLVIGIGFMLNDAIRDAAKANLKVKFALVDSRFTEKNGDSIKEIQLPNAKPLLYNTGEVAFLAGYLAAGTTKTGKIATYGGMSFPVVNIIRDGFEQGIKQFNLDNKKEVKLLGWDYANQQGAAVGNFEDQSKAKQLTESFISSDADIILPVAGNAGLGSFSAMKSAGKGSIVWVDSDGYESTQYGDIVLTSIIKKIDQSVYDLIKDAKDNNFTNQPYVGTIENKGVLLAPYHNFDSKIPNELKEKIKEYEKKLANGEVKINTTNNP